ncbi:MAG: hypothetical protein JSV22_06645 [Bacteroidales bacterium]|nr:MAG: hypothetical protein JSV22_06645 [Bacteroidales bacterium]
MGFQQINKTLIITVLLLHTAIKIISAAEEEPTLELYKTKLGLNYTKKTSGDKILMARLTSRVERKWIGIKNAEVYFYAQVDTTDTLLGKTKTDDNGESVLHISASRILKNYSDDFIFKVKFEGNETYTGAEKELKIRNVEMIISLSEVDSIKTVNIEVYETDSISEKLPLEDVDVYFYVTRLFGLLKIGEGWLINGKSSIEFPNDLPGDTTGNLTIVARIEDNEVYGNVEVRENIDWGIAISHNPGNTARELWTRTAPLWMIISLVSLLSFAWIIYIMLFYNMYRIRKTGSISNNNID